MHSKTALITGSAKRIGNAIAMHLAKCNYNIILHYNSSADLALNSLETIEHMGGHAIALQADLQNETQTLDLIKDGLHHFGSIDCIIHNASIYENDSLHNVSQESWNKHLIINCFSPILLTRELARHTQTHHKKASVISLLDSATLTPRRKEFFSYQMSKAMLRIATEMMAIEFAPHLQINAIAPGTILQNDSETYEEFLQYQRNCPMKEGAGINNILESINYILTNNSLTGVTIPVDGGKWLQP
jgi:NAD(P)-dependent dehydrogenase (short-subunit alcohol dehydrogenase family)